MSPETITELPAQTQELTDDGGGDNQLVIMTTIMDESLDQSWTARVAVPLDTPPGEIVQHLLAAARGAAASYSTLLHSCVVDQLDAAQQRQEPPKGLTVAMMDQLAEQGRVARGRAPDALTVPGLTEPVPFETVRAVLVMAGAW